MNPPIVYCETNWIVALAFPHHQLHREAKQLWEHARAGHCELRTKVDFRGKDVVDLHLLAAILKDRRAHADAPALLMSHNKKEFDPRKNKVPAKLYEDARLLWRDDFQLSTGLGQWQAKYSPS